MPFRPLRERGEDGCRAGHGLGYAEWLNAGAPMDAAGLVQESSEVSIGDSRYLLPVHSTTCVRVGQFETSEEIEYRGHSKFDAGAAIDFGEEARENRAEGRTAGPATKGRIVMSVRSLGHLSVLMLSIAVLAGGRAQDAGRASEKDGTLVVLVTWGDIDNTPADDVYVEAHGFVRKYRSEKSFVLKMSRPGRYEASLSPGVYDVFVSEGGSVPRCRRVLVSSGFTGYWTLKLEVDDVYSNN